MAPCWHRGEWRFSSLTNSKLTINALGAAETFVAVHVTADITQKITIGPTSISLYVDGNIDVKVQELVNQTGLAGNFLIYGISPTDPTATQSITISPPGDFAATMYAPGADVHIMATRILLAKSWPKAFTRTGMSAGTMIVPWIQW